MKGGRRIKTRDIQRRRHVYKIEGMEGGERKDVENEEARRREEQEPSRKKSYQHS